MTYDLSGMKLSNEKKSSRKLLLIITLLIIAIASVATTFAAITANQNVTTNGSVTVSPTLGVYSDAGCTVPLGSISWGNITAGSNVQRTIYVKNTGSGCSLALGMTTSNWSFTNNGNMTLTWNQEGTRINPGQSVAAVLTLAVSPNIVDITTFNVQISITGTN